jgi:hypothetical protein
MTFQIALRLPQQGPGKEDSGGKSAPIARYLNERICNSFFQSFRPKRKQCCASLVLLMLGLLKALTLE